MLIRVGDDTAREGLRFERAAAPIAKAMLPPVVRRTFFGPPKAATKARATPSATTMAVQVSAGFGSPCRGRNADIGVTAPLHHTMSATSPYVLHHPPRVLPGRSKLPDGGWPVVARHDRVARRLSLIHI